MIKRFEGSAVIGYVFRGSTTSSSCSGRSSASMSVVGHTDNVGGYEHNMGLSQRRDEAVVKELTTRHGIPATRLKVTRVLAVTALDVCRREPAELAIAFRRR